jgi:histidine triad (HIT) family protein
MSCPYCPVREQEQRVIFKNDLVLFLQDERYQGALKHSGVIIPVQHRETVFDLSDAEVSATFHLLLRVKKWMDDQFSPDGYNIGWNCGRVGGQEVFHAHMHVIPRFRHEPLAGKGLRSLLKSDANRSDSVLRSDFDGPRE